MFNDPKILTMALVGGIIPSLFWLWFWIKEEEKKPEPTKVLTIVFILGMLSVFLVLPIQKFIKVNVDDSLWQIILWAGTEEVMKFIPVLIVVYRTRYIRDPIEWPIYVITAALGFAAMENCLFLIKPLTLGSTTVSLLTGQLRFLGSTLLHAISSGILGIALGITMHLGGWKRAWHVFIGFLFAIALHSVFNFFIMKNNGNDFLKVFSFLWVVTIVIMLLFEKVRRMN